MPSLSSQLRESFQAADAVLGEGAVEEQGATATAADEALETPSNGSPTDPISRLPPELTTACFRFLSFRWRFAVSQVCRAWRRAALADCCLWNTLQTDSRQRRVRELLETLLARSGDVPFNFCWASSVGIPADVLDMLARNMYRTGKLKCWGASPRLLQYAAPALRLLSLYNLRAVLPADWAQSVPRLEYLELDEFSIPADFQPLPALTTFIGCLVEGSSAPVLAHVFPRLVTLDLEGVTQETVCVLGAPPPSCRSVSLRPGWASAAVDYAPFLRACHGRRVADIALSGAASVGAAAEEFARATRGECTMFVRGDATLTLESAADGVVRVVQGDLVLPFVAERGGFAHLDRLAELALPLALLLGIAARPAPGLPVSFPALRLLRLLPAPADVRRTPRLLAPLAMPRLAEVVLEAYELDYARDEGAYYRSYNALDKRQVQWLLADWPAQLRALVSLAHGLNTLTVVMACTEDAEHFAARQDLGALRALADTLNVTHRRAFLSSEESDEYVEDYEDEDDFDEY